MDLSKVDTIIRNADSKKTQLIGVLQDVQKEFGYLPFKALVRVAETLDIPLQQIYNVATFYKAFNLKPQGRHRIAVCLGTACHVRGARNVLDRLQRRLGIHEGCATEDRTFSLEAVRCVGACSLAPIVMVNDDVYGRVRQDKVAGILHRYENNGDSRKKEKNSGTKTARGRKGRKRVAGKN